MRDIDKGAQRRFSLAVAAVLLAAAFSPAHAAVPAAEKNWLAALYNSTGGAGWANRGNWLNGDPCDNHWHGVSCDAGGAHVTVIDLPDNRLTGALPEGLNRLTQLQGLVVKNNRLSGAIPALTGLTQLSYLAVEGNLLTGSIPALPASLQLLQVHNNRLSGPLPAAPASLIAGDARICQTGDGNAITWSGMAASDAAWQGATLARYHIGNCQPASTVATASTDAAQQQPKAAMQTTARKRQRTTRQ